LEPTEEFAPLFAASREGNAQAIEELWRRFERRVRAYTSKVLGTELCSTWTVDEVLQQVSIDLVTQLPHLPPDLEEGRFTGILLKFAHRRSIDACRRSRTRAGRTESIVDELAARISSMGAVTMDDAKRRIRELVADLPAHYARIIQLHDLEGLSLERAAESLGIQPATARKQHSRAMALLLERTRGYRLL
jgi:RNA polymerase sigma factor (sigma-70 family)